MRISFSDDAFEELADLAGFIAQQNEAAARSFLEACDVTFFQLAERPLIGALKHFESDKLSNVRMWRVKGFDSYLIFYIPLDRGIHILHLIHAAQDYNRIFEND